jgi:hypothetical protein
MQQITVPEDTVLAPVTLVGVDGNAFVIMGTVAKALKRAGNSQEVLDSYSEQSVRGDYDHMLQVAMAFCVNGGIPEEDA